MYKEQLSSRLCLGSRFVCCCTCHPSPARFILDRSAQLADPDSSIELEAQLKTLGLRVHTTLGDGNCLFRALSDQLYGTEAHHLTLRADITAWMAKYKDRYEGFVEDDRSFEDHLRCMRQTGTFNVVFSVGLNDPPHAFASCVLLQFHG